ALAVAPDAARALVRRRRLDDGRFAARAVDLGDERSGERAVPDVALGCRADAVRPGAARRLLDAHLSALGLHLADEAALAGEPEVAVVVEGSGVEVRVRRSRRQRKDAHAAIGPADADDRVLAAVGEPRCVVGTRDDAVRRRAAAERD